jgi:hypothetical protein
MNESENKFLAVIKENEIDVNEGNQLAVKFTGFMEKMATIESEAKSIVVTDVSQKEEMKKARELRLTLKDMRVESEKVRVSLKEESLRKGKVIDALAKIVKETILPIEEYLDLQEKFAENLEKQRIEKQNADRLEKISKYADPVLYNYKEMADETFENLLQQLKDAHDAKVEAEKKAEAERIEKERLEKEEAEKNRVELARLKAEQEEREKREAVEAEERRKKTLEEEEAKRKIEAERKAKEEEMERKHQAELKAERDRIEALEKEAKEKERKEAEDKKAEEDRLAKIKAETEEAERQKALAPEKDKLFAYAEAIKATESPQGLSQAGLAIVKDAEAKLLAISQEIKEALKTL